ncbi:MAG: hypothetical protein HPY44_21705 [Armatimonadetes bacterium]|nr:hypothetical protein [Armatimonadota bacterium]
MSVLAGADQYEITYALMAGADFPDYLMAIWDVPREVRQWRLDSNAGEFIWVENTDGNCRGIVRFDLAPECTVRLRWDR